MMQVPPASEDDRLAKAALYTKFTGVTLKRPAAVMEVAYTLLISVMQPPLLALKSSVIKDAQNTLTLVPFFAVRRCGWVKPQSMRRSYSAAETLPAAVRRWRQLGVPLLLELLAGVRAAVEGAVGAGSSGSGAGGGRGGRTLAQQLFAQAQAFLQVANILNEEYPEVRGRLPRPNVC